MAFRHEIRPVELDARVDAVVGGPEGARRVESKARRRGLGRAGGRTRKAAVVEVDAHRAVRGYGQVGLELVNRVDVVVDQNRSAPGLPAVVGRGQVDVGDRAVLLVPCDVERVVPVDQRVAGGEGVVDAIGEGGVGVASHERRDADVADRKRQGGPSHSAVCRDVRRD